MSRICCSSLGFLMAVISLVAADRPANARKSQIRVDMPAHQTAHRAETRLRKVPTASNGATTAQSAKFRTIPLWGARYSGRY
jgi:hypothetical protein